MRHRNALFVAIVMLSATLLSAAVAAEHPSPQAKQDWPAIIAQLRAALDRTPDQDQAGLRQQLSIAYNNYAVTLADQGRLEEATKQAEEALRLDPASTQFQTNLSTMLLQASEKSYLAHRYDEAKRLIARALAANPRQAQAYALLGEIEYDSQHLKEAKVAWQKALALDPSLTPVKEKLGQLNQELPVESHFEKLSALYFDIRYNEGLERAAGFDIQDALLSARRDVGSDFTFWPQQKLVVLVYSAQQFHKLRQNAPEWVAGQYDGKIRVPLPGQDLDKALVTHILHHEYTHAVVHELTHDRLPTWFNEGLAEYEAWKHEHPPWLLIRDAMAKGRLVPWANLSSRFSHTASTLEAGLAYEEAHNIVRYLVERYGFWRIKRVLKAVDADTPLNTALASELHIKLTRLEENWRAWLTDLLATSPAPQQPNGSREFLR